MAVTQSPRFGITRWSAGTDPLRRSQLDADHAAIEALAAIASPEGLLNARPPASTRGRFYYATDTGLIYYDTGAAWATIGAPPDLTPYARKDGATFTGNVTLGDADTDVLTVRAVEVDTHTRSITNGYTNGKLTTVTEKAGATTVKTTTLAYTGEQLTTVTEVAGGKTITTTLTYDGNGVLTGTTRTVA